MATPSTDFKQDKGFFHSLGRINMKEGQYLFESTYKSGHNVTSSDVRAEKIPFAKTFDVAKSNSTSYNGIIKFYDNVTLTEISGTNQEAYCFLENGNRISGWISPVDVIEQNERSDGYEARLYDQNGTYIPATSGVYVIDYFSGLVLFQKGYTPNDLGWGTPKLSFFSYIGKFLDTFSNGEEIREDITFTSDDLSDNKYIVKDTSVANFAIIDNNNVQVMPDKKQVENDVEIDFTDWDVSGTWTIKFCVSVGKSGEKGEPGQFENGIEDFVFNNSMLVDGVLTKTSEELGVIGNPPVQIYDNEGYCVDADPTIKVRWNGNNLIVTILSEINGEWKIKFAGGQGRNIDYHPVISEFTDNETWGRVVNLGENSRMTFIDSVWDLNKIKLRLISSDNSTSGNIVIVPIINNERQEEVVCSVNTEVSLSEILFDNPISGKLVLERNTSSSNDTLKNRGVIDALVVSTQLYM